MVATTGRPSRKAFGLICRDWPDNFAQLGCLLALRVLKRPESQTNRWLGGLLFNLPEDWEETPWEQEPIFLHWESPQGGHRVYPVAFCDGQIEASPEQDYPFLPEPLPVSLEF